MVDYGKSGNRSAPGKQPRNKTVNEHPRGKLGRDDDKAALLARMKAAATRQDNDEG
ncbi:MAG: hypothetical protein H6898_16205 [Rhodobacter sp.]|nr:hypothetical protein [Paracoccaceae bacterium]MCC0078101.1 hypothetical protein [Rhodobacter sp.]